MHLTNYAINKGSENFVPPTGAAGPLPRTETMTAATTTPATEDEEEDEDGDDGCAQAVAEEDEIHVCTTYAAFSEVSFWYRGVFVLALALLNHRKGGRSRRARSVEGFR